MRFNKKIMKDALGYIHKGSPDVAHKIFTKNPGILISDIEEHLIYMVSNLYIHKHYEYNHQLKKNEFKCYTLTPRGREYLIKYSKL